MFNFICSKEEYNAELLNIVKLFYPDLSVLNQDIVFDVSDIIYITVFDKIFSYKNMKNDAQNTIEYTRFELRHFKICLFKALKAVTRQVIPWGSLTGIRPTKLFYELMNDGNSKDETEKKMRKTFLISKEKATVLKKIISSQNGYILKDSNAVNLYIHLPFCPSRCSYCSFVSTTIDKQKMFLAPYCDCLIREIQQTVEIIKRQNKYIYSVYIGGGTPTCLPTNLFEKVLVETAKLLPANIEFTLEAGRPETITKEKLQIMKANSVTRISVNPQTLKGSTLVAIGRKHTISDFFNAYNLSRTFGFIINVDLIAGLDNETLSDFKSSVHGILSLAPENVTIHTLSKKNGSILSEKGIDFSGDTDAMLEFANKAFLKAAYEPYYLYRQKQMIGNLENVGYTKPGFQCVNNITSMEETLSVYACGAGAISKLILKDGRIERLANVKDVKLYIEQFEDRAIKKEKFYLES